MNRVRRPLLAYVAVFLFSSLLLAQQEGAPQESPQAAPQRTSEQRAAYRKAMEEADQKIADEVKAHSELVKNLEYLTTQIGPRLTGSPQMQVASEWTLKRFRDYGVDAHLETTEIAHGWTRGLETAEITSPVQKRIGYSRLRMEQGNQRGSLRQCRPSEHQEPFRLEPVQRQTERSHDYAGRASGHVKERGEPRRTPMTRSFRVPVE